jgi:phenylpropionate dioxygenase-like ring-hydroxylating dioxygenase large terminal subunit
MTTSFIPASELAASEAASAAGLPRGCTFSETDWRALAPFWYPVAFSHEISDKPYAARLLDERVVVYRLSDGTLAAARDICFHRGIPLSMGRVEGDEIICKYHGLRYDREGRCTCIPAHPNGVISPRLRLQMFQVQERYGLVWVRLVDNGPLALPEMKEWDDPEYPKRIFLPIAAPSPIARGWLRWAWDAATPHSSLGDRNDGVGRDASHGTSRSSVQGRTVISRD